jgi:dihydrofolate reductase
MPEVIVIAALAESNRVIGKSGKLPWSIPEDLRRFKHLTLHHTVIMGRKTWQFDLEMRSLPHRQNVVISRFLSPRPNILVARSLTQALQMCANQEKVFLIGGASVYAEGLEISDSWRLTIVEGHYEGDTFFPQYDHLIGTKFERVAVELREGYRFESYQRQSSKSSGGTGDGGSDSEAIYG